MTRWCLFSLTLLAAALPVPLVFGGEEPIEVTVVTILASTNGGVGKNLEKIAEAVQQKNPEFKGFVLKKLERETLGKGKKHVFPLMDKEVLEVKVEEKTDDQGRPILTIKAPTVAELKYGCCCGVYFPILTKYETPNGERLIVAIMTKHCPKK